MFNWLKNTFAAPKEIPGTPMKTSTSATPADPCADSASCKDRGDKHLEQGRLDDDAGCYKQAVSLDPANVDALFSLGAVYIQQNSFANAER